MSEVHYGGQAVIEGVMMRGAHSMAVAVRKPTGDIQIHSEPLPKGIYDSKIGRLPFVRGLTMLWDTLVLGTRALMFSADAALTEEDVKFEGPMMWGTLAFSVLLGIGLFVLAPMLLVGLMSGTSLDGVDAGDALADALVKAVADKVVRIREEWTGPALAGLVVGGDKALIVDVFDDPRLESLTPLPRRDLYDLPDPRLTVLQKALDRGRSVRVMSDA